MQRLGVFETIVRVATRSDYIHVAIVPAPNVQLDHKGCVQRVAVHDIAFTAFMFLGYDEESARSVLRDEYDYIFMPVAPDQFENGCEFLRSLQGLNYNYIDLAKTVLPRSWKKQSQIHQNIPTRVFCSQVGLMLCFKCGIFKIEEDPAACSPGELFEIICKEANGLPCYRKHIAIIPYMVQAMDDNPEAAWMYESREWSRC